MSELNSPTINKAIGRLVRRHLEKTEGSDMLYNTSACSDVVVITLDLLGYLGVLDYSKFDPKKVEESMTQGGLILEIETIDKTGD